MDQVFPHNLWLGHASDGRNSPHVFENGIKAIVQVAIEEPPLQPPRELVYLRFPLTDGAGNRIELIELTIMTVANLLEMRVPTLVCCGAGLSRSPAIAAAALAVATRETPESCLRSVVQHRHADVSPGLWSEILLVLSSRTGRVDSL